MCLNRNRLTLVRELLSNISLFGGQLYADKSLALRARDLLCFTTDLQTVTTVCLSTIKRTPGLNELNTVVHDLSLRFYLFIYLFVFYLCFIFAYGFPRDRRAGSTSSHIVQV